MSSKLTTILWHQFGATLDMLENAIKACPEHVWFDAANWQDSTTEQKTLDTYKAEFWYWAYHVIFWTDYYLSNTTEEQFQPKPPYTKDEFDERGLIPLRVYSNDELLEYLNYCREKLRAWINSLNDQTLFDQSRASHREDYSVLEILLYNLRHVQHHSAQLNLLLRQRIDSAPRWVSRTKHPLVK